MREAIRSQGVVARHGVFSWLTGFSGVLQILRVALRIVALATEPSSGSQIFQSPFRIFPRLSVAFLARQKTGAAPGSFGRLTEARGVSPKVRRGAESSRGSPSFAARSRRFPGGVEFRSALQSLFAARRGFRGAPEGSKRRPFLPPRSGSLTVPVSPAAVTLETRQVRQGLEGARAFRAPAALVRRDTPPKE